MSGTRLRRLVLLLGSAAFGTHLLLTVPACTQAPIAQGTTRPAPNAPSAQNMGRAGAAPDYGNGLTGQYQALTGQGEAAQRSLDAAIGKRRPAPDAPAAR